MQFLSVADIVGILFYIGAWVTYHYLVETKGPRNDGLNALINQYRVQWMLTMSERESRIVNSAIMGSLQNGTAFFASTSLIALGGAAALLRATDDALQISADLPLGLVTTRMLWEAKVLGLVAIFGYAFFKFSWSYRLFNYAAILIGVTPQPHRAPVEERRRWALRAAHMNMAAAGHFNRGQRAFFFALAYLGWFLGPYVFIAMTGAVLYFMWARQFASDARRAALFEEDAPPESRA